MQIHKGQKRTVDSVSEGMHIAKQASPREEEDKEGWSCPERLHIYKRTFDKALSLEDMWAQKCPGRLISKYKDLRFVQRKPQTE